MLLCLAVAIAFIFASAFADPAISLDKSSYEQGQTITVSGSVQYDENMPVIIQIRSSGDIVAIDQFMPQHSGSFSKTFDTDGPKWAQEGTYKIIITFNGQKTEKTFQITRPAEKPNVSNPQPQTQQPQAQQSQPQEQQPQQTPQPKISLKDFPDINLSPNYYFDRYKKDPEFKKWFDSTFSGHTIQEVVGYRQTKIAGFPDPNFPPKYYIDRYNTESLFHDWFDSQFQDKTIYDIVGVPENLRNAVPGWIKQYSKLWATGDIDDDQFIKGIEGLISQGIISVNDDILKMGNKDQSIPSWLKNTAGWYSDGQISEKEFLVGIQYLVEKEIIVI